MKRYCLALDLKDDEELIQEYIAHHETVKPAIIKSFVDTGILNMEIFRVANRLFMILETDDGFSFEEKAKADAANPAVQVWEALMWKYQQPFPFAKEGEKWMLMEQIFSMRNFDQE